MHSKQWKTIADTQGRYEVSNEGDVRSFIKQGQHHKKLLSKPRGLLKLRKDKDGYMICDLHYNGNVYTRKVHHLVALAFVGPRPTGHVMCHKNNTRSDNKAENLEWGTMRYNLNEFEHSGLFKKGTQHLGAKLNNDSVFQIRKLIKEGRYTYQKVGDMFGVGLANISLIALRKTWKHI